MSEQTARLSFEFFPPMEKSNNAKIIDAAKLCAQYQPSFFSVTFGACGNTQDKTKDLVFDMSSQTTVPTAPHITCINTAKSDIDQLLVDM